MPLFFGENSYFRHIGMNLSRPLLQMEHAARTPRRSVDFLFQLTALTMAQSCATLRRTDLAQAEPGDVPWELARGPCTGTTADERWYRISDVPSRPSSPRLELRKHLREAPPAEEP